MAKPYVICNCGKWSYTPAEFDELKHNMRCECGEWMFLHRSGSPMDAGYTTRQEITTATLGRLR